MLEKIVRKFSSISPLLLCCCIVLHLALERTTAVVVLLSTFPNFSYPEGIRPALALLPWGWVRPLIHPLLSAVTACNALLFFDFGSGLVSKSPPPPKSTISPSLSAPSPPNNPVLPGVLLPHYQQRLSRDVFVEQQVALRRQLMHQNQRPSRLLQSAPQLSMTSTNRKYGV